jgi:hypothetical protein
MDLKKLNKINNPIVIINPALDKYKGVIFFPEKLAQANETLKRVGLPKSHTGKLIAAEPKAKYGKK